MSSRFAESPKFQGWGTKDACSGACQTSRGRSGDSGTHDGFLPPLFPLFGSLWLPPLAVLPILLSSQVLVPVFLIAVIPVGNSLGCYAKHAGCPALSPYTSAHTVSDNRDPLRTFKAVFPNSVLGHPPAVHILGRSKTVDHLGWKIPL